MKSIDLIFIEVNSNFSELFFSQICFNVCFLLHSINLRFIIKICGELNALNIVQAKIFKCTEFSNLAWTFNFAEISITLEINWEEMFSFRCKLTYLLIVALILDIYYSKHKVFSFKFVFFFIEPIVLKGWQWHHWTTQNQVLFISTKLISI